jgi:hypothetical protein
MSGDQIKPQTVKFRGRDVQLNKQNIIDIAAYVAGNKHILGFAIDDGVRKAADAAYKRLDREGKAALADYMLRTTAVGETKRDAGSGFFATAQQIIGAPSIFGSNVLGGISAMARQVGSLVTSPIETLKDDWSAIVGDTDFDKTQVEKAFDIINNDKYSQSLSSRAENLRKFYNVSPNAKGSIFTGNAEDDRKILSDIKELAGAYKAADQNLSGTFDEFSTLINSKAEAKDLTLGVKSYPTGGGGAQFQIVGYDDNGKEVAMTIQPDEARRFGLTSPYVSNPVSILENRINSNGGQTSYGSADVKQTYINGDAYFQKVNRDFPGLVNSPYNVMANITTSNGLYYGKIFVQDPATNRSAPVFTTPGGDLETIYNSLRSLNDNFVRSIISNK